MVDKIKKQIDDLSKNLDKRIENIINKDFFYQNIRAVDISSLCGDDRIDAIDCISSMLLLSHAEFETYIEGIARIIFDVSKEELNDSGIINYHCCSLFVWYVYDCHAKKIDQEFDLLSIQHLSVKRYNEVIDNNHGITKENIHKLFKPLGFNKNILDEIITEDVIDALSQLKNDRGLCGHNGIKIIECRLSEQKQQYIPNYISKSEEINNVRRMLENFANQIIKFVKKYSSINSKI